MNKEDLLKIIEVVNSLDFTLTDKFQRSKLNEMKTILNKEIKNHNERNVKMTKGDVEWLKHCEKIANKEWDYEYGLQ